MLKTKKKTYVHLSSVALWPQHRVMPRPGHACPRPMGPSQAPPTLAVTGGGPAALNLAEVAASQSALAAAAAIKAAKSHSY